MTDLERYWSGARTVTAGGLAQAFADLDEQARLVLPLDVSPRRAAELLVTALKGLGQGELVGDSVLRAAAVQLCEAFPPGPGGTARADAIEALRAALEATS